VKLYAFLISALYEINILQVLVRTIKHWVHEFEASYAKFAGKRDFFFYVSIFLFPILVYLTHFQLHSSYNQSHSLTSTHFSLDDNKNSARNE